MTSLYRRSVSTKIVQGKVDGPSPSQMPTLVLHAIPTASHKHLLKNIRNLIETLPEQVIVEADEAPHINSKERKQSENVVFSRHAGESEDAAITEGGQVGVTEGNTTCVLSYSVQYSGVFRAGYPR